MTELSPKKHDQRIKRLIDPIFQIKFITYCLFLAICIVAITYGGVTYFFIQMKEVGLNMGFAPTHAFFRFIEDQRILLNWIFLIVSLFSTITIILFGLYFSHRIVGPLYALQKFLRTVKEANPDIKNKIILTHKLKFRQNDFFKNVEASVNDFFS